jgi:hypothetical protein
VEHLYGGDQSSRPYPTAGGVQVDAIWKPICFRNMGVDNSDALARRGSFDLNVDSTSTIHRRHGDREHVRAKRLQADQ